ncbi:hypothetical protein [Marinobacterium litorale]|uniref:hypothetical protein n=1 Tax=Marinobacterium litorale TaxID=404770 RepID=UPI00040878A5|nr:hypothetical protein [Marinobacterium litorale]
MTTQVLTGDVGDEQKHVGGDDLILEIGRGIDLSASSLSFNQQIKASRETGLCADGHPCGKPEHQFEQEHCDWCPNAPEIPDSSDHIADAGEVVGMAALYPAYYKDVRHLDSVDVYQVHNLFGIDDPTGCIHHASKKLLLSGARTGGKPKRKDIQEARDTLTRWLEITEVRNV